MNGILLLALAGIGAVVSGCSTNSDCAAGCCYMNKCAEFQNISDPCHLPNRPVQHMKYPCGCAPGLVCDEIHFDPNLPPELHQAEVILLGHGYGLCTDTPGTLFGK